MPLLGNPNETTQASGETGLGWHIAIWRASRVAGGK
jgi:hypothetical protein